MGLASWPQGLSGWGIWRQAERRCPGLGAAAYPSAVLMGVCKPGALSAGGCGHRSPHVNAHAYRCMCTHVVLSPQALQRTQGHFLSLLSTPPPEQVGFF